LGPGGRSDMIDDFIGHHNWTKTLGIGSLVASSLHLATADVFPGALLLSRMVSALSMLVLHRCAHEAFSEGLRDQHPDDLICWEKMVRDWERDGSNPNPYVYASECVLASLPLCIYLSSRILSRSYNGAA
jgi:hypothetical protein